MPISFGELCPSLRVFGLVHSCCRDLSSASYSSTSSTPSPIDPSSNPSSCSFSSKRMIDVGQPTPATHPEVLLLYFSMVNRALLLLSSIHGCVFQRMSRVYRTVLIYHECIHVHLLAYAHKDKHRHMCTVWCMVHQWNYTPKSQFLPPDKGFVR